MPIHSDSPSLPRRELARHQSNWLRGARTRLFRQVNVTRRTRILELGAGWGDVSIELADRSEHEVLALDRCEPALRTIDHPNVRALCADAHQIPLPDDSVDLVVTQFAFLWFHDPPAVIKELARILKTNGAIACIEPDYGGLIEYPLSLATRDIWIAALNRNAANPLIGRSLPTLFASADLSVDTFLLDRIASTSPLRLEFLEELNLTKTERQRTELAATNAAPQRHPTVHLPVFLMAIRP